MYDFEFAFYLYKISRVLEIFEENKYKSKAFFKAGMAVDSYSRFIWETSDSYSLKNIEGIGDSSLRIINELKETGSCEELDILEKKYNIDDYSLILSHGISSKLLKKLFLNGIKTARQLESAVFTNDTVLSMLGKTEYGNIKLFIEKNKKLAGYYLYSYVHCLKKELLDLLNIGRSKPIADVKECDWQEKSKCISIVCINDAKHIVYDILSGSGRYHGIIYETESKLVCRTSFGIPVEIYFPEVFSTNPEFKPVLRGDLHMHTNWSDGKHSIKEMLGMSVQFGREYIGISDHSYSLKIARGISEVDALRQIEEIAALEMHTTKVFSSIEVEILRDGHLDFSDTVLEKFDYVIAGIHTHLQQPSHEMKARIEKALANPYVSIFAHPTGKLLGRPGVMFSERSPISVPFKEILDICEKNNVVLELNCFPERFDIGTEHFHAILNSEAHMSVGTDSHSIAHLNCLEYAEIMIAKYPEIKKRIINLYTFENLKIFFNKQRESKLKTPVLINKNVEIRDFNYYFKNNSMMVNNQDTVIGIDLTGNESKPSGWAALIGNSAITKLIGTDDDLIGESIKYHPKVISIDSPLSYPKGRHCTDPNCECRKYGITRYCERLLMSFGIGVYPCLIPSMEKLTNRGIALASKFRGMGLEVIESYPGVAQDVLGIHRKQKGLEHLKASYKNFGIAGDYLHQPRIAHDELDAIASALVGLFYISGQYTALGNADENYLYVPNVVPYAKNPVVIGITGEIGAGKTTLSEYLCFKHGFRSMRYSEVIQKLYDCDNNRNTLQNIGREIAGDPIRQQQLSLEIIKEIEAHPNRHYVIDGIRQKVDFETLSTYFDKNFFLLYIKAPFNKMLQRYNKRGAEKIDKAEFNKIVSDKVEEDISQFMGYCYTNNNIITNDKTFKEYFESIDSKVKEILCQ